MKIHNLLEEIVTKHVDDLFSDPGVTSTIGMCTCDQCRLDVICYALNRLSPRYIVSGKGATHVETEFKDDFQNVTDIASIVNDGINKVKMLKRPNCSIESVAADIQGPICNFPSIAGKVFDGDTFEPLCDVDVFLYQEGVLVEMMNSNWTNPYRISANTPGTFSFWPKPYETASYDLCKVQFELRIHSGSDGPSSHFFSLDILPEKEPKEVFEFISVHKVDDIYIFD